MKLNPYLSFSGQCEAAFRFYEQCLGGHIEGMMRWGESPMAEQVSPEWRNKIMHAQLTVGDQELMGADSPPEQFEEPKGFSILISVEDPSKAEQVFQSLAENGTVKMPIQETFWATRFGMLVDQFGIPWMINCDKPA
jgi:PhnB protein